MTDKPTSSMSSDPTLSSSPTTPSDSSPSYVIAANAIHHLRLFHESMRELGTHSKQMITLNNNPLVPTRHNDQSPNNENAGSSSSSSEHSTFSIQISPNGISLSGLSIEPSLDQLKSLRSSLFKNPFLSDCILSVKGLSPRYYCHRAILREQSEFFGAMFSLSYAERDQGEVEISLQHPEMFEEALRYIYKGSLSDKLALVGTWCTSVDSYFQLVWVANYLQVPKLLECLTGLFEVGFSSSALFNSEYMTFSLFQSVITACRQRHSARGSPPVGRVSKDPYWLRSGSSDNRIRSPYNLSKRMRRISSRSSSSRNMGGSPDWMSQSSECYFESTPLFGRSRSRSRSLSIEWNRHHPYEPPSLDRSMLGSSGSGILDGGSNGYSNSRILQTTFSYAENSSKNSASLGTGPDECKEVLEWVSAENLTEALCDSDVVDVIKSFPGTVQKAVDPYGLLVRTKSKYRYELF